MNSQNDINTQVYALLEDLTAFGMKSAPRGRKVVEANVATLDIDPLRPIMDFDDRKFNWKYLAGELAWYLKRTNNIDLINNFSSFWGNLTNSDGTVNSNYGDLLLSVHPSQRDANYDGSKIPNKPFRKQLEWVFNSLVDDKDTRQAVAFLNCPYYQYEGNKDFVCTMYLNFWIRHDRLDMKVQMRSNDIFFGLSYDAPWFSLIQQSLFLELKKVYPELKLGMYYHCADNIHYYERHFDLVEKIISAPVTKSPKFELKAPLFEFDEFGKMSLSISTDQYVERVCNLLALEQPAKKHSSTHFPTVDSGKITNDEWKALLCTLVDIVED
jgi:thymidylate synthase